MQRTWIHFIGKQYYTINQFVKEAKVQDVSRAIAPAVFKRMQIGDLIVLAQKDGGSTKIFGAFKFASILGLNPEIIKTLKRKSYVSNFSTARAGNKIERGCGEYEIVGNYEILNPDELMEWIRQIDDLGRVMIGGKFLTLSEIGFDGEDYILCKIPFQKGFRRFHFEQMKADYIKAKETSRKYVKIDDQYYVDGNEGKSYKIANPGLVVITNYQLN